MPWTSGESRRAALALLGVVLACSGWLGWKATCDPGTPFLPDRHPAAWVLYPTPASTLPRLAVGLDTVFRREITLADRPAAARLRVLWYRSGAVRVNGTLVARSDPGGSWKQPIEVDVAPLLRPGANRIEAQAVNGSGPPALWLSLEAGDLRLGTDPSWEASLAGASWRKARLARAPVLPPAPRWIPPGLPAANPHPLAALRANLPLLGVFALVTLAVLGLGRRHAARRSAGGVSRGEAWALLLCVALAWSALCWNNRHLSARWGFDASSHQEYIRVVLTEGRLPLADEGWEMYQPPLYYALAAGLLRLAGHTRLDGGSIEILHGLGWAAGLLQCAALLASLRLLFPERPRPLLVGLLLGAFLPVQLYMFQYVTNEPLHAALVSSAVYLALRILSRDDTSARAHALLGSVLGLAMLAKFSALIPLVVIAGVLAGRLVVRGTRETHAPGLYARTLGTMFLAFLLVCGWHYARVAWRFGSPLVGNWDPAVGFAWWQDPGYRTSADFLRFGRSLVEPIFSAFWSLSDAVYSTLWGDGMLGGSSFPIVRPPWSYGLMAAGYLLALLPMLAILTGVAAAVVRLVRKPRAEGFLLLGLLGATSFAVAAMSLKLPFYAQTKAFYGLAALIPISVMGALGCEVLARRGRLARTLVYVLLGTWALNAYATFWIPGSIPGEPSPAALAALDPEGLVERSARAEQQNRADLAVALARRATEIDPDHPFAWMQLGSALRRTGATREAVAALREALRVAPREARVHGWLGHLYAELGATAQVRYHLAYARKLDGQQKGRPERPPSD